METAAHGGAAALRRIALGDTLHRTARRHGARCAVIEDGRRWSYAELDADSSRFAHYLQGCGLAPGARVAMLCSNSMQFLVAAYGILKAGLVWVPVNTLLGADDIGYILAHAEASLVVADRQMLDNPALAALLESFRLPLCLCGDGEEEGTLAHCLLGMPDTLPPCAGSGDDLALIMYTSGTTGKPKGVMHSHLSVLAAISSNIVEMGIRNDDVFTCILPLFHCAQFSVAASCVLCGAALLVQQGFEPGRLLAALARERVTMMFGLPLMYGALLQHPARAQHDLSHLRFCMYAMAPMPKPLLQQLIAVFCPNFALGSGQTEIFPMTMYFGTEQQLRRFGNYWGEPTCVNEVALMDESGQLLGRGQIGEIVHRGANVMLGYYKDAAATAASRRHGWHHTGDLGMFDEDGQLLFVDRLKDIIKSGGENVASVKVEEVLLRHPAVANAAVVGIPHPRWVEGITAFVLARPGASCDTGELLAHCRAHLAGFEVPKHIALLEQFPTTPTGKVQKHLLRSRHRDIFMEP